MNAGGWARPASDILFGGSPANGVIEAGTAVGAYFNRTNGYNHTTEAYVRLGLSGSFWNRRVEPAIRLPCLGTKRSVGGCAVRFLDDSVAIWVLTTLISRNGGTAETAISNTAL